MNAFNVTTALNAETRHARICVETLDLLVDRHQREDVVDTLFDWQIGILEGMLRRRQRNQHNRAGDQDQTTDCTDLCKSIFTDPYNPWLILRQFLCTFEGLDSLTY